MEFSRKAKRILSVLGAMNLMFAAGGLTVLAFQSWASSIFPQQVVGAKGSAIRTALHSGQAAALTLLIPLAYLGILFLRARPKGIGFCQIIFLLELGYVFVTGYIWPWLFSSPWTSTVRGGFLNAGIALQVLMGYPVIGIALLHFVRREQR